MSHLSAAAPGRVRPSGRLQTPDQVRTSGRLEATEQVGNSGRLRPVDQAPGSGDERPRTYTGSASNGGTRRHTGGSRQKSPKGVRGAQDKESGIPKKILIPVVVIVIGVAAVLLAPAAQWVFPQVDAKTSISALAAFRSQPSKRPGKTVDQCVNELLDESRKSGDLVRYSGWSIRPINFNKSQILVAFSFEEKDGVRIAEWLADVNNNTFIPKNDLATQVYVKTD